MGLKAPGSLGLGTAPKGKTHQDGRKEDKASRNVKGSKGHKGYDFSSLKRPWMFLETSVAASVAD